MIEVVAIDRWVEGEATQPQAHASLRNTKNTHKFHFLFSIYINKTKKKYIWTAIFAQLGKYT